MAPTTGYYLLRIERDLSSRGHVAQVRIHEVAKSVMGDIDQ